MKKKWKGKITIIAAILLLCVNLANAQTWHDVNQITVAWDAVAPIQPDDVITYIVYKKAVSDGSVTVVEETAQLQSTVTFTVEGSYTIGVSTKRLIVDGTVKD